LQKRNKLFMEHFPKRLPERRVIFLLVYKRYILVFYSVDVIDI
jgi:hypothetical protein